MDEREEKPYVFRLYVTGTTPKSTQAVTCVRQILESRLRGLYILEVIDIYQQPLLATGAEVTVVPTLVRERPLPVRKIVGHLCEKSILAGLNRKGG